MLRTLQALVYIVAINYSNKFHESNELQKFNTTKFFSFMWKFPDLRYDPLTHKNVAHIALLQQCCLGRGPYRTAENFRGRKLSRISWFCGYTQKFSPQNLGHSVLRHGKSEQSAEVFSTKIVFSPIRKSFLPWKFPAIWYNFRPFSWNIANWKWRSKPARLSYNATVK